MLPQLRSHALQRAVRRRSLMAGGASLLACPSMTRFTAPLRPSLCALAVGMPMQRCAFHNAGNGTGNDDEDDEALQRELEYEVRDPTRRGTADEGPGAPASATSGGAGDDVNVVASATGDGGDDVDVVLERLARPPGKYDVLSATSVYRWRTTAKLGRKIIGPLREWGDEFKYRTGVHVEMDPVNPEKAQSGGYATADEVEVNVYFFGADKAIKQASSLIKAMVSQDPSYVRLAVFRRRANTNTVEWLALRRINNDLRPPDIPAISLKTPGKSTLLFENFKEAAVRTLWEETGIHVDGETVVATGQLRNSASQYYWRVPVRYFIAEVPEDVDVQGPQAAAARYMTGWDQKTLRLSTDPIDRAWAALADPKTGCAWLTTKQFDDLQLPLKGERYMAVRYTPPPSSGLQEALQLVAPALPPLGDGATDAAAAVVPAEQEPDATPAS